MDLEKIKAWLKRPVLTEWVGLLIILALTGLLLGTWGVVDKYWERKFFTGCQVQKDLVDYILHSPNRYIVRRGDTLSSITRKFFHRVDFLTLTRFQKEIITENKLAGLALSPGQVIAIPHLDFYRHQPNRQLGWPPDKKKYGIYLAWTLVASPNLDEIIDNLTAAGGNSIVFDIKDVDGYLRYRSDVPLAKEIGANKYAIIPDIDKFIYCLHKKGVYVIARQALFADNLLAGARPDMAIDRRDGGGIWIEKPWFKWVDAGKTAVQDYNLALAKEAARHGIDEVQFDYCRFPTEGDLGAAIFQSEREGITKYQVIESFLQKARAQSDALGVPLGVDLFGIVSWQRDIDIARTGQRVPEIAKYVNFIYPMLYPSHFNNGFDGRGNPADFPAYFIGKGTDNFLKLANGNLAKIIPWIQGFSLKVSNFGPDYLYQQMKAAVETGGSGFMVWNAGGEYSVTWPALKQWTSSVIPATAGIQKE